MDQKDDICRKGPWTEREDVQLVFYVNLFGDRRWDFIAKVSGLKRTGKSCRLRWVNYLHPTLKRGKMTPHEERLVLELHAKWGNRWSRIARKLPGRTDNEIKNYWRTHMRKIAQDKKRAIATSKSSSLSNSSSSSSISTAQVNAIPNTEIEDRSFYDTGGLVKNNCIGDQDKGQNGNYSMDEIWNDIVPSYDDVVIKPVRNVFSDEVCNFACPILPSPVWEYSPDSLWMIEEESKMFLPITDIFSGQ